MTTTTLISVEEYLLGSLDFEPDAECVDGVIEERPEGELDHATWQAAVHPWLYEHRAEWNIRVRVALRVQ